MTSPAAAYLRHCPMNELLADHGDEERRVRDWRLERLLELGFDVDQALALLNVRADWHDAETLLALGCPHAQAMHLLA